MNDIRTEVTGHDKQPLPSPLGMAAYENAPANPQLGAYIFNHKSAHSEKVPETKGRRVDGYERVLLQSYMNDRLSSIFSQSEKVFDQCPKHWNKDSLLELRQYVTLEEGKAFFKENHKFQDYAVEKWRLDEDLVDTMLFNRPICLIGILEFPPLITK